MLTKLSTAPPLPPTRVCLIFVFYVFPVFKNMSFYVFCEIVSWNYVCFMLVVDLCDGAIITDVSNKGEGVKEKRPPL